MLARPTATRLDAGGAGTARPEGAARGGDAALQVLSCALRPWSRGRVVERLGPFVENGVVETQKSLWLARSAGTANSQQLITAASLANLSTGHAIHPACCRYYRRLQAYTVGVSIDIGDNDHDKRLTRPVMCLRKYQPQPNPSAAATYHVVENGSTLVNYHC